MWRISLPYFGLVCSVLLSNKDREDRQGGVGRGVLSNGSLEFETMKAKRKARAVWRAARPPEKGLYGSILRHSFLSLLFSSLPPPSTLRFLSSTLFFLPPFSFHNNLDNGCVRRPVLRCSPWAFFVAEGRRSGRASGPGGGGIKEPRCCGHLASDNQLSRPCRKIRDTRKSISTVVAPSSRRP